MRTRTCLDNAEAKSYGLTEKGGTINFSGWGIKNPTELIREELEDYFDEFKVIALEIIKTEELAYSCNRYSDGEDASEEGYKFWMEFHKVWKRGLGKLTEFTVAYKLQVQK